MATRSHGGSHEEGGGAPRVRAHGGGGGTGSVVQLTAALKAKFDAGKAMGKKGTSALLANADEWDSYHAKAKTDSTAEPPKEAVVYLHDRGDFHSADFRRKSLDLAALGDDGKLSTIAGKTSRPPVTHKQADKFPHKAGSTRTLTNIYRDRIITRLSKAGKLLPSGGRGPRAVRSAGNQELLNKLYEGKNPAIRRAGVGLDPDHIHELQLKGRDVVDNLRLMDSYTNRQMGSDIRRAIAGLPPGTPVIVRLVE